MKDFCKKHTGIFILFVVVFALFTNLITGFVQSFFTENAIMYYLAEAVCKYSISIIPAWLMIKWGYTGKSDKSRLAKGFALGMIFILFAAPNIIPLLLVNPILFKVQWALLLALTLAMFSIGLLEEAALRGVVLPLLCEKWQDKKNVYWKAAVVSSLLFGCIHLNWSVRYFLTYGTLSWDYLSGNLYQVYYTFCFGILAAGVAIYTRSILPMVFWHGICDLSAAIVYGILPLNTVENYNNNNILTLQNVFNTYGIFAGCKFGVEIILGIINLLFIVIGAVLIKKGENRG